MITIRTDILTDKILYYDSMFRTILRTDLIFILSVPTNQHHRGLFAAGQPSM